MKLYLIGLGGIGVSALARYYLAEGWEVSGWDTNPLSSLVRELKAEGVKIKKQLDRGADLVIYSQAVSPADPLLVEARARGLAVLSYPEALGKLTAAFKTLAVAGSHGKSTTTALLALTMIEAGFDPTVIVGTKLREFGSSGRPSSNFRSGRSPYLVIEADEYKDAFLNYHPYAILITNIDREHLDYFKDLGQIKQSFQKFIASLFLTDNDWRKERGILVLNKDSSPLLSLRLASGGRGRPKIIWYSLKEEKKLAQKIKKHLKIPGEHNLANALGVYQLARALGLKENVILRAFSQYRGAWRRMEYRGRLKIKNSKSKIEVYDDYAHHPTEIKATLAAFRGKLPKAKIICVFQPHQADRLKKLFKEFVGAFDQADFLILLDVFRVSGREKEEADKSLGSKELAAAIQKSKRGPRVAYLPRPGLLRHSINQALFEISNPESEAVVIMMGAGDIVDLTPKLLE